jgi:hypothetical protein
MTLFEGLLIIAVWVIYIFCMVSYEDKIKDLAYWSFRFGSINLYNKGLWKISLQIPRGRFVDLRTHELNLNTGWAYYNARTYSEFRVCVLGFGIRFCRINIIK